MDYKNKLQAFFHDPLDKPFKIKGHENRARYQINSLNLEYNKDTSADHITSAADRILWLKSGVRVDFCKGGEITHPLGSGKILKSKTVAPDSEDKKDVVNYINYDEEECNKSLGDYLKNDVYEKYSNIKDENERYKKIFLHLWRNFPEESDKINEIEKNKIGKLWHMLPADTRIPDHSILSHNLLTSAISSCKHDPVFVKFGIGPVQGFISTAKRTEDLWAGSYILSYLTAQALIYIVDNFGPDHIIFPNVKHQPLIDEYLTKIGIEVYKNELSKDKISAPSIPNVFFAILPNENIDETLKQIEKTIKDKWIEISDSVIKGLNLDKEQYLKQIFDEQIKRFIECYWSYIKTDDLDEVLKAYNQFLKPENIIDRSNKTNKDNLGNYWAEIYHLLDKLFNARKSVRDFAQIEEIGEKCSLCGERVALTKSPEEAVSYPKLKRFWNGLLEKEKSIGYVIDKNESLCGVCLTKRLSNKFYFKFKNFNFPSTATISSIPFREKLIEVIDSDKNEDLIKAIENYYNELNLERFVILPDNLFKKIIKYKNAYPIVYSFLKLDGHYYYPENINEKDLPEYEGNKEKYSKLNKLLNKIYKTSNDNPIKYYAIIAMDGDKMGEWISGTHKNWPKWKDILHSEIEKKIPEIEKTIPDIKKILTEPRILFPAVHSFISLSLAYFSLRSVPYIIEEKFSGKLVYAGGDDVLALVPLDRALETAEYLRFYFTGNINKSDKIDLERISGIIISHKDELIPTMGNKASASAGICFAHHSYNLQDAIQTAKNCEKNAKHKLDRDSFYVKILKRSGSSVEFGLKWTNNKQRNVQLINDITQMAYDEILSNNFFSSGYQLLKDINDIELIKSLIDCETKKHIDSKIIKKLNLDKKEQVKILQNAFNSINEGIVINENRKDKPDISDIYINILQGLRFLATKGGRE